jgi:hypothetical protein
VAISYTLIFGLNLDGNIMLTVNQIRKIEPELRDKSEEEIIEIRRLIYALAQLSIEKFQKSGVVVAQKQ